MERKIIKTSDGSSSIYLPQWEEHYHSRHGAIQEAYHVFIKNGLEMFAEGSTLGILEMGFGTGLNCMITYLEAKRRRLKINYTGIEAYPLDMKTLEALDHVRQLRAESELSVYNKIHSATWDTIQEITSGFELCKQKRRFEEYYDKKVVDLVYFDAFGARVQPELWTEGIFSKMYAALKQNGIIVTYSAKGSVRRAMQAVGFKVERLPGPPGKREMLRGVKME